MNEMGSAHKPSKPYLFFHPQFVRKHTDDSMDYEFPELLLKTDVFHKPSFAIDIDCRRFVLKDVVKRRAVYAWWNLPLIRRCKIVYVDYCFGSPEQLTFEQARDEFVDYVCAHRWWSSSHESEEQFRNRNARYSGMAELMGPVSLKGKLPKVNQK
ncbi:MAG: hypothetical protein MK060_01110 [Blastomonas sp.]|jgi:hypothetical protein|uniref:hypothetical protein n=1 Tax=unclassified Blastomonas TaxID=2626550 RepID=UPI0010F7AA62|nr:hypothetical protein [Blastomonas sp.]MCH2236463.1 hypothetical protein [Blastomonas sp.]|tara:strand:- start:23 stop:487 length:465 start_codon:yes stop_codon:yes gene_type:complete